MKRIVLMVVGMALIGTACGGSSTVSAKSRYDSFRNKYSAELKEVESVFGTDSTGQTFEEYVASLDNCDKTDSEGMGMITMLFGPELIKHGHSVTEFIRDGNQLMEALQKEGLCPKA